MSNEDETTIKVRAYSGNAENLVPQSNLTEEQSNALELVKKNAQLEDERKKLREHMQTIEQLRESIKQEQAKTAEMVKKIAVLEAKEKELAMMAVKVKEFAGLEAKVKELTEALGKISSIAASAKVQ